MPEFVLDKGPKPQEFNKLPAFVRGYIEAMFFTSTGPDNADEGLGDECHFGMLNAGSLKQIIDDCTKFQADHAAPLAQCYEVQGYDEEAAGRDFWYSRNGHGVGYFDRDLPDSLGEEMQACAEAWGEIYLVRGDDGMIHHS